jgi:hypothetical protein
MKTFIGTAHRERILKSFFPGCRVLVWGSGDESLWFADRLPTGATLTSIDHNAAWHERIKAKLGVRSNVRLLVFPPSAPMGRNATIEEEDPVPVQDYIRAMEGETFDVILVDGVARNACLEQARHLLHPRGTVFLHDAHRPWYDAGKALFVAHGTVGSCPEYPAPLLWWGGTEQERPRYSVGALPVVISFFTEGTSYEQEVKNLKESLELFGMEADIQGVAPLGTWERNCAYKARFIRDTYFRLDRPVLWLDADAVVRDYPLLVAGAEADFAIHRCAGWQFASGTLYFNRTCLGQLLLETWVQHCEARPDIWDQIHIDRAWEEVTARHPLYTMWLPQSYAKIFDREWENEGTVPPGLMRQPVIEQFQASRRLKQEVSSESPKRMRKPSAELVVARRAGRPRTCFYDSRLALFPADSPEPDGWALTPEEGRGTPSRIEVLWRRLKAISNLK